MRHTRRGTGGAFGCQAHRSPGREFRRIVAVLAVLAVPVIPGRPAQAQETDPPAPPDSLVADSLVADSLAAARADSLVGPLEQPLVGTLQDSTVDESYALLAAPLDLPPEASSSVIMDLGRDRILQSNALTLLELLEEYPGFMPLRATWFGGPHQVMAGGLGPAFLTVRVNGREVTTMDGGQPDLTRFPLAYLQRVRLVRANAGWVVEITTLAREKRDAYSRIEGGTGDPGLSRLRLVFDNGLGRSFRVAASADLVDVTSDHSSNDFDFFGLVEWVPVRARVHVSVGIARARRLLSGFPAANRAFSSRTGRVGVVTSPGRIWWPDRVEAGGRRCGRGGGAGRPLGRERGGDGTWRLGSGLVSSRARGMDERLLPGTAGRR